jgi:hypothetical protein
MELVSELFSQNRAVRCIRDVADSNLNLVIAILRVSVVSVPPGDTTVESLNRLQISPLKSLRTHNYRTSFDLTRCLYKFYS